MSPSLDRTAKKIWKTLRKGGEASFSQLVRKLDRDQTTVNLALRRLACEAKIAYRTRANQTFIFTRGREGVQLCLGDGLQLL